MGRGRVEMKKIENRVSRQVTFSKRRRGLLKKAHELAVLCDVAVGVVIFSENGKLFEYSNPPCSMGDLIRQYEITSNTEAQLHKANRNDQQMMVEMGRLANEKEQLESNLRICMGEDLSTLSVDDLSDLEQHLQSVLSKVRARKHELHTQLLDDLRRKTEETVVEMEGMSSSALSGSSFPMEPLPASSTVLQLWPQTDSGGVGGSGSSSPRGASSCKTRASPGCGLQLW
ncbi:hypothetical protein QOZ80_6AG0547620 [Eleusine coracana subsp. coracana]|nr:hypothetical protein QOZ80_6AG0547620 [Eleusine coracana subsp. coracana]